MKLKPKDLPRLTRFKLNFSKKKLYENVAFRTVHSRKWRTFKSYFSGLRYGKKGNFFATRAANRVEERCCAFFQPRIKPILNQLGCCRLCKVVEKERIVLEHRYSSTHFAGIFATLLQNELNSHVARLTTHESNLSCNKSGCWKLREYWLLIGWNYAGLTPCTGVMSLAEKKLALWSVKLATCTDFVAKSRTTLDFLRQIFTTCNDLNCSKTCVKVASKTPNIAIQLLFVAILQNKCTFYRTCTLSNDDSGDNENKKRRRFRLARQQLCMCIILSCLYYTTTTERT